jgi:GT2 family glycosyltransferase
MTEGEAGAGRPAPLFSVVMPTYETAPRLLREAIESVRAQTLASWELCVVDDGSRTPGVRREIERQARRDDRVKPAFLAENRGISTASNRALELGRGEWIAFLDHDDTLEPRALERIAAEIATRPEVDVLYTDQDTISADGKQRVSEFLKPDWSPVYALGAMYVGHLLVARRALVEVAGGFDPAFDTIQDFELLLRLSERTDRIAHISEILYHWRAVPGSIAAGALEKPGVPELQARAVNAHLRRRGIPAEAAPHPSIPHRNRLAPTPGAPVEIGDEFLLFFGEGVETVGEDWVERLAACARIPGVGAVGPLLLRPDGRVDSGGFRAASRGEPVVPLARGVDPDGDGYYGSLACAREVFALGERAMLVRRAAFEKVGGFCEEYRSTHRDFDLCRKLAGIGLSCVYNPAAQAIDHELPAARRRKVDVVDRALFIDRWFDQLERGDPFSPDMAR